jgi:hypothetical protein
LVQSANAALSGVNDAMFSTYASVIPTLANAVDANLVAGSSTYAAGIRAFVIGTYALRDEETAVFALGGNTVVNSVYSLGTDPNETIATELNTTSVWDAWTTFLAQLLYPPSAPAQFAQVTPAPSAAINTLRSIQVQTAPVAQSQSFEVEPTTAPKSATPNPVSEPSTAPAPGQLSAYVTQDQLAAQIQEASNALRSLIYQNESAPNSLPSSGGFTNEIALSNDIDNLSGSSNGPLTISDATFSDVSGLTASEIPDLSSSYLSLTGGGVTGTTTFSQNVGIGTSSPSTALSVLGTISATDDGASSVAQLGSELTTDGSFTSNPSGVWTLGSGWSWDSTNSRAQYTGTGGPILNTYDYWGDPTIYGVVIDNGGTGYTNGDTINISGGTGDATYTATVSSGVVTKLTQISGGTSYTANPSAVVATTGGTGTGLTVSIVQIADAATLTQSVGGTYGQPCLVSFTIANYSGHGSIKVSLVGPTKSPAPLDDQATSTPYQANGTYTTVVTDGNTLQFNPTGDFSGGITNVSVKPITPPNEVVQIKNTDGSDGLDLYPGGIGLRNTFIGQNAGVSNTTGAENTAVGYYSFFSNTTGSANNAFGKESMFFNTSGGHNCKRCCGPT